MCMSQKELWPVPWSAGCQVHKQSEGLRAPAHWLYQMTGAGVFAGETAHLGEMVSVTKRAQFHDGALKTADANHLANTEFCENGRVCTLEEAGV